MNTLQDLQTQEPKTQTQSPWLLCFAHRAEAKEILKGLSFKAINHGPLAFEGLFHASHEGRELYVLITGEGLLEASTQLSLILGAFAAQKISPLIINYGIAASLRQEAGLQQMFSVKTVYAQKEGKQMHFHSYQLGGELDCLSVAERLLDDSQADFLSAFAPIAERELWGICHAAQKMKAKVIAFKWISDEAWKKTTTEKELCQRVRDEREIFGHAFLEHFKDFIKSQALSENQVAARESDPLGIIDHPLAHFSLTQKRQYQGLLKSLELKDVSLLEVFEKQAHSILHEFNELKKKPKEASSKILELGHDLLWPYEKTLREKLKKVAHPLEKSGAQVSFDSQREQVDFTLKARIQHPQHIEKLKKALDNFSFEDFEKIMNGQDHV